MDRTRIQEVVLFISSTSEVCKQLVSFLTQQAIRIPLVRLDTPNARTRALNGKYFKIQVVPTLVVTLGDGKIQLYSSANKIVAWLKQSQPQTQPQQQYEEETEVPISKPKKKKKSKKSKKHKPHKNETQETSSYEEEETGVEIEFLDKPKINNNTSGLITGVSATSGSNKKVSSLQQTMKEMEQARKDTNNRFGWKDDF